MTMSLVCHCGFETTDAAAFLDHCLTTGHIKVPLGDGDDSTTADALEMLKTVQRMAENPEAPLPEHVTGFRRVTAEDILGDDELSDEQKREILDRFADVERKIREKE